MSETATIVMPLLASLLTAVLVSLAGYVLLVPRLEERLQGLKEDVSDIKQQIVTHTREEREREKSCIDERKRHEDELYNKANENARAITRLETRLLNGKTARGDDYIK